MINYPVGSVIEINSITYPNIKTAEVLKSSDVGYVVKLDDQHETIIFNSEIVGMAGQNPTDTDDGTSNTSPTPATVDPKVLNDAMKRIAKKIKEKVPDVDQAEDPVEAYDRAMKGVL